MARRAVVIGSNGPSWQSSLDYAENDAKKFACALKEHCGFEVALIGADVPSAAALEKFQEVAAACAEQDSLIFYFSGHGDILKGKLFLLLRSTTTKMFHTGINASYLLDAINFSLASHKLTILDCCHAGGAGFKGAALLPVEKDDRSDVVLCASDRLERARELPELNSGFMTFHICELLSRRQKTSVTLTALVADLQLAAKNHNKLSPERSVPVPYVFGEQRAPFFLKLPQGPASVLVRFDELDRLDADTLMETIRPFCALNHVAKGEVKVELEPPKELRVRIEQLNEIISTDMWPAGIDKRTQESVRKLAINFFQDLADEFRAAIAAILKAGTRPDLMGLSERSTRVLQIYLRAKMLATKRQLAGFYMIGEERQSWVRDTDSFDFVYSNNIIYGLTSVSDGPDWAFWTDADWWIEDESYRVFIPMIYGKMNESAHYTDEVYLDCLLPQLFERYSGRPDPGTLKRLIVNPGKHRLWARNEVYIDTVVHSFPSSSEDVLHIIAAKLAAKVVSALKDEHRDDRVELAISLMTGGRLQELTRHYVEEAIPELESGLGYLQQLKRSTDQ